MSTSILSACVYVQHVCLVFAQVRRKCQILWSWSYKQLLASVLVLGLKPGPSAKTSTLTYRPVSRPSYMASYCSPVTVSHCSIQGLPLLYTLQDTLVGVLFCLVGFGS